MELRVEPGGVVRCLYAEAIDLAALGALSIRRASHVEPDEQGHWWADMSPMGGALLGPLCGAPHNGPYVAKFVMWSSPANSRPVSGVVRCFAT
jgi:hypothetical protein